MDDRGINLVSLDGGDNFLDLWTHYEFPHSINNLNFVYAIFKKMVSVNVLLLCIWNVIFDSFYPADVTT